MWFIITYVGGWGGCYYYDKEKAVGGLLLSSDEDKVAEKLLFLESFLNFPVFIKGGLVFLENVLLLKFLIFSFFT